MKKLSEITDEDIKNFSIFSLSLTKDEIVRVMNGDGWKKLEWQSFDSSGYVFVSNRKVTFSNDNQRGDPQNASFREIKFLIDLGYDVFG